MLRSSKKKKDITAAIYKAFEYLSYGLIGSYADNDMRLAVVCKCNDKTLVCCADRDCSRMT